MLEIVEICKCRSHSQLYPEYFFNYRSSGEEWLGKHAGAGKMDSSRNTSSKGLKVCDG
jgi:hypothetical protein